VIAERYWNKVQLPTGEPGECWVWVGARNGRGYGNINMKREKFTWTAHRYFYTQLVGHIPEGLTVDHLCRNTSCVNPAHMELVTLEENSRRQAQTRDDKTGRFRRAA
jgi:hypothetical protein